MGSCKLFYEKTAHIISSDILSFDFLLIQYFIIIFLIAVSNLSKNFMDRLPSIFYEKYKEIIRGLIVAIIVVGFEVLYLNYYIFGISLIIVIFLFLYTFIPIILIIEITKRCLKNKSLV